MKRHARKFMDDAGVERVWVDQTEKELPAGIDLNAVVVRASMLCEELG
jgi:hypothetical protein